MSRKIAGRIGRGHLPRLRSDAQPLPISRLLGFNATFGEAPSLGILQKVAGPSPFICGAWNSFDRTVGFRQPWRGLPRPEVHGCEKSARVALGRQACPEQLVEPTGGQFGA